MADSAFTRTVLRAYFDPATFWDRIFGLWISELPMRICWSIWKRGEDERICAEDPLLESLGFICVILFAEYSEEEKNSFSVFNSHPPTPGFSLPGPANILRPVRNVLVGNLKF